MGVTTVWPAIWTATGAIILACIQKLLSRPDDLRKEIEGLRTEVRTLNDEVKQWRGQFYFLLDATVRNDKKALHTLLSQYVTIKED